MIRIQKLDNGIPLLLERMDGLRSVAMGIWVLAGSRYERPDKNGISHFLEHMFFKGTKKRSAQDIAVAIDSIGAELNAFTSKEHTAFYIKVMDESIDEGLELLFDIFTGSEFPEEELKREQSVVCEEIKMVLDTPDDLVHDLFSADLWGGDALGQPILGSEDTVRSFTRDDLRSYASSAYGTDRIVISCAGNFNVDRIGSMIGDAIGVSTRDSTVTAPKPSEFIPGLRVHKKDLAESHVCIGIKGIEQNSPDRYKALLERVDARCQSKLDEPPEGSFIALQDAEKAFATEVATIVADAFLSSSGFGLVAYKALAEEAEAERDTAIRERYKAIERGVCAVEVAQYYHMRWTTEKQDMVVLRDMWRQAEALAERREREWDFLCSLLKTFAEGLDGGRRKALLALPNRARAAIEGRVP